MRGATHPDVKIEYPRYISTHAPHARRDVIVRIFNHTIGKFLLTRLMRGATFTTFQNSLVTGFLLTRLMRGATGAGKITINQMRNFYSRASCEARRSSVYTMPSLCIFLLTRLMRGATVIETSSLASNAEFLLTRLMRGATRISL